MDVFEGAIAVDRRSDDDFMAPGWGPVRQVYPEYSSCKPPRKMKKQTKGGPSFGCYFLRVVAFLFCLRVVGASSPSAPGSSAHSTFYYVGVAAAIIGTTIAAISLGVSIYYHKRDRGDGVRGALDML